MKYHFDNRPIRSFRAQLKMCVLITVQDAIYLVASWHLEMWGAKGISFCTWMQTLPKVQLVWHFPCKINLSQLNFFYTKPLNWSFSIFYVTYVSHIEKKISFFSCAVEAIILKKDQIAFGFRTASFAALRPKKSFCLNRQHNSSF